MYWLEEPNWYDDLRGHAALARTVETRVAVGEQPFTLDAFRDFVEAGAIHFVRADAVRTAEITERWQ